MIPFNSMSSQLDPLQKKNLSELPSSLQVILSTSYMSHMSHMCHIVT